MSLDFEKVTYVDGETVIGADNLNDIQDAILDLDSNKVEKEQGKGLSTNDYTNEEKAKVAAAAPASALDDYRTAAAQDTIDAAQDERIDAAAQATTATTIGPAPIATFDASVADMPLKGLTVDIEPVQSGSGDPSPENVRPITGWTGCNVTRAGKNLLDRGAYTTGQNMNDRGEINSAGATSEISAHIPVIAGAQYTFSCVCYSTGYKRVAAYTEDGIFISPLLAKITDITYGELRSATFTIPENAAYLIIANNTVDIDVQLELCSSATAYEPYQGTTYPITFPTEAGTVYGGTLTINADGNGELAIDRAMVELDGTETYQQLTNARWHITIENCKTVPSNVIANIISDSLVTVAYNNLSATNYAVSSYSSSSIAFHLSAEISTTAQFKQWLSDNTPMIVFELVSPVVVPLSAQQITTLLGTNNIWADCGDVTVTYGAYLETVKAHAERLGDSILSAIAPLETTYTASRAYAVGEFLFVGTKFYKVTAAIAEGGTITPGTNAVQTTVAEQLMTLAVKPAILG